MEDTLYNDSKTTGELTKLAANALLERGWRLTTAESCTGATLRRHSAQKRIPRHFMILAW